MNQLPPPASGPAPSYTNVIRHSANVERMRVNTSRSEAAAIMGSATGGAKAKAAKKNGAKGGRPEGS